VPDVLSADDGKGEFGVDDVCEGYFDQLVHSFTVYGFVEIGSDHQAFREEII
jgi:hypothetical protein